MCVEPGLQPAGQRQLRACNAPPLQFVFPKPPHGEAHPPQRPPARPVTPAVAHQLRQPVAHVGLRHMAVLRASVVEAPIGEYCEAQAGDDHVWLPRKRADVHVYPPPPSAARTEAQSLASGVVPELLMRDMISLRFSGVKTSAISPRPRLATPTSSACWHAPPGNPRPE
jgi:hypothetical protein